MAGKAFVAQADQHRSLVLGYLQFPEMTEIFHNVAKDRPLSSGVLSEWDQETLEGHIQQFILPLMNEAGAISKNSGRRCGYETEFDEIIFEGLTRTQLGQLTAKRATIIGRTLENGDSREEALSANFYFHALPEQATPAAVDWISSGRIGRIRTFENSQNLAG